VVIGASSSRNQIDGIFVVELVNLKPALARRKIPAKPVDKHTLPIMVHLQQSACKSEPVLRQDDIDHLRTIGAQSANIEPCNYRVCVQSSL
jgi:hypothetical protein